MIMKKSLWLFILLLSQTLIAQNVGIGTTTPLSTLDVKGNQRIGGTSTYMGYDSISGKILWTNSNLFVPVSQALMKHSAAGDGLFYNNSGGVTGQLEYRNAIGEPVFFTNFTNGLGYFKSRLGIATTAPLTGLHVADSSVLFSVAGYPTLFPGPIPIEGIGRRMLWYADLAAFRVGFVQGNQWDKDSIGMTSFAAGYNTKAKGNHSTAFGLGSSASGLVSTAMGSSTASGASSFSTGLDAVASGSISSALGYYTVAKSGYETALGSCNTLYTPASTNSWVATDRLFGIGNGPEIAARSDALVILKNGNIGIGYATPGFKLSFAPLLGDKISLWSNSTNSYGFGIQGSQLQIHTDVYEADIVFGYGSSSSMIETMRVKGDGNVGIGTNEPNEKLHVNGNIECIAVFENSDRRLKKDIVPMENSLQKITQLNGYTYYWQDETKGKNLQAGIVAQEVQQLFPELVKVDKEGMLSVNYSGLIPVMIESTKELNSRVEQLEKQNAEILIALKELQEKNR